METTARTVCGGPRCHTIFRYYTSTPAANLHSFYSSVKGYCALAHLQRLDKPVIYKCAVQIRFSVEFHTAIGSDAPRRIPGDFPGEPIGICKITGVPAPRGFLSRL
jgi:hypothetical protein